MKRVTVLALAIAVGCRGPSCGRDTSNAPPPRDELVTALVHFREPLASASDRLDLAKTIVKVSAIQDAAFRETGDVYRHHTPPEPPYDCLLDGSCFARYLQQLNEAEAKGVELPANLETRARTLLPELSVDALKKELQRRIDYVADRLPRASGMNFRGSGERTVYVLSTGHPIEPKRTAAIDRILVSHAGRVRFGELSRARAPALFDALGLRLTAVALVDGRLCKDLVEYEQWLEVLFPNEPLPPIPPASTPIVDAHEHVARGGGDRLAALVTDGGLAGAVVAALPKPSATAIRATNEDVLGAARSGPPFIVPFVTVDETDEGAPAAMQSLLSRGARGLKLLNGHDDFHRARGSLLLDPPVLRSVFDDLEARSLPVLWHVNTHLYAHGFLRTLEQHPNLVVVNPHLGGYLSYAPGIVRQLLVTYPNLNFDLSFGTQPRYLRRALEDLSTLHDAWRKLLIDFPDRFLFGLDMVVDSTTSRAHARMLLRTYRALLENEDFDLDYFPARGFSTIDEESHHRAHLRGLSLPRDVLAKIYASNANRLYGLKGP
jgi:predicted TIM-barrel fold metal-dependent hydrolase